MAHPGYSGTRLLTPTVLAAILFLLCGLAAASSWKELGFSGKDGAYPNAGLIADSAGNLYGTTPQGGSGACRKTGCGLAFELARDANGRVTEKVLYAFTDKDGSLPEGGLIADSAGNFYGTTSYGGAGSCTGALGHLRGCGVVFELTPGGSGRWTERVLYSFAGGADGSNPSAGLILDSAGNLYGTTSAGGPDGFGTVFELSPGGSGQWAETILHTFTGGSDDGAYPRAGLVFDGANNLYGTTFNGGPENSGTVFELSPSTNGQWSVTILHGFTGGSDGGSPDAGLTFDSVGNLYGASTAGGAGAGVVFELAPGANGQWSETVLHAFDGGPADGDFPYARLIFDSAGNLYGTTVYGGSDLEYGVIFKLTPGGNGQWTETILHSFTNATDDGEMPYAGLIFDGAGNLYGTTSAGSSKGVGGVFRLSAGAKNEK